MSLWHNFVMTTALIFTSIGTCVSSASCLSDAEKFDRAKQAAAVLSEATATHGIEGALNFNSGKGGILLENFWGMTFGTIDLQIKNNALAPFLAQSLKQQQESNERLAEIIEKMTEQMAREHFDVVPIPEPQK